MVLNCPTENDRCGYSSRVSDEVTGQISCGWPLLVSDFDHPATAQERIQTIGMSGAGGAHVEDRSILATR
jgi:hypothetical protein